MDEKRIKRLKFAGNCYYLAAALMYLVVIMGFASQRELRMGPFILASAMLCVGSSMHLRVSKEEKRENEIETAVREAEHEHTDIK